MIDPLTIALAAAGIVIGLAGLGATIYYGRRTPPPDDDQACPEQRSTPQPPTNSDR